MSLRVSVSARLLKMPGQCVCCSGNNETTKAAAFTRTTGVRVVRQDTRYWDFPHCYACLRHAETHAQMLKIRGQGAIATVAAPIIALFAFANVLWLVPATAAMVWAFYAVRQAKKLQARLSSEMQPKCSTQGPAVQYEGWQGSVHTFVFANDQYATLFQASNAKKLVG